MYTLKIRWSRHEEGTLVDESTLFIPADQVIAHSEINFDDEMPGWEPGTFMDYRNIYNSKDNPPPTNRSSGRLILVERDNKPDKWYVASQAWILGPDGKTIERLN